MKRILDNHPTLRLFYQNVAKDNIGVLAGFVSWNVLTSLIPLTVGVVAISSLFLQSKSAQADLVRRLSQLFQGAVSTQEIDTAVQALSHHSGLLGIVGVLGVLWGASNIGGSFATAFRVIFATRPRPFIREKLLDVGMLFVFTGLMVVILSFILILGAEVIAVASMREMRGMHDHAPAVEQVSPTAAS
mgnify:CR=1 FL=1